jgi:hypothetical protein
MDQNQELGLNQAVKGVLILFSIGLGTLVFLAIPLFGVASFAGLGHLIADSGSATKSYQQNVDYRSSGSRSHNHRQHHDD